MNKNLLIVGAGIYSVVAHEIAEEMGCFEKIDHVDDNRTETPNGIKTVGKIKDMAELAIEYNNFIVAIENPDVRLSLLTRIHEEIPGMIVALVSPRAYVSRSAQVNPGCIVEPMAVVHTGVILSIGCIVSAGAVVNHASFCSDGVHVDCNATVSGCTLVPAGIKICSGMVYKNDSPKQEDLFFDSEKWAERMKELKTQNDSMQTPLPIDGKLYSFDDVM